MATKKLKCCICNKNNGIILSFIGKKALTQKIGIPCLFICAYCYLSLRINQISKCFKCSTESKLIRLFTLYKVGESNPTVVFCRKCLKELLDQ